MDYTGSESMLGLGDIVLPGLLLVWAARLDLRRCTTGFGSSGSGSGNSIGSGRRGRRGYGLL